MEQTVIAKNMRRLMEGKGLNPLQLSYDARIPPHRIYALLSGNTKDPQISTVSSLARALGVSVEDLLTETEDHKLAQ